MDDYEHEDDLDPLSGIDDESKGELKEFHSRFKEFEKQPFLDAATFAADFSKDLSPALHWRVCLIVANDAKRRSLIPEARLWFDESTRLMPTQYLAWLEYAKLEEECGCWDICRLVILRGLAKCPLNESLLVKGVKHEEKMGNLVGARSLLARLRGTLPDRTWRTVMEGALFEARTGNVDVAREVFKYLIRNVPWNGPVYNNYSRMESKYEEFDRAMASSRPDWTRTRGMGRCGSAPSASLRSRLRSSITTRRT
jgi:hypothetical protein